LQQRPTVEVTCTRLAHGKLHLLAQPIQSSIYMNNRRGDTCRIGTLPDHHGYRMHHLGVHGI